MVETEKMKQANLIFSLKWEYKVINGDLYFVQGVLPNGKVLIGKTLSEQEFKSLFNYES